MNKPMTATEIKLRQLDRKLNPPLPIQAAEDLTYEMLHKTLDIWNGKGEQVECKFSSCDRMVSALGSGICFSCGLRETGKEFSVE